MTFSPQAPSAAHAAGGAAQLYVRHAARNGRRLVSLRAVDHGVACVVEADVASSAPRPPTSYTFADAHQATHFVTEAVEALMYLGCEITDH